MKRILIPLAAMVLLAAACGDAGDPVAADDRSDPVTEVTEGTVTPITTPPVRSEDIPEGLRAQVTEAREDLEGRGVAEAAVILAEFVVWPDRSLGCPLPDVEYVQVLSEGYRIVLEASGATYHYHGGGGTGPFLCDSPGKPAPNVVNPGGGDT